MGGAEDDAQRFGEHFVEAVSIARGLLQSLGQRLWIAEVAVALGFRR